MSAPGQQFLRVFTMQSIAMIGARVLLAVREKLGETGEVHPLNTRRPGYG